MRTTIDIPDQIMDRLKAYTEKSGRTLKDVIAQAITLYFSQSAEAKKARFILPDESVGGKGLSPEFQGKGWEVIRDALYPVSSVARNQEDL
jgi:hypothetical protein